MSKIIGISGVASSGKDTLCELLQNLLPKSKRFALADNVKKECASFFEKNYGIDIFSCSREEKELIRPILVTHGKVRRIRSHGTHWTRLLKDQIGSFLEINPGYNIIITDIRYDFFPEDEVFWLKDVMKGVLVHVKRYELIDESRHDFGLHGPKKYIQAPNQDETENDPKTQKKADFRIEWPTVFSPEGKVDHKSINIYAEEFVKFLNR